MKLIRKSFISYLVIVFITICTACSNTLSQQIDPQNSSEPLHILCTIQMIENLVKEVGGPFVTTELLIKRNLDPHTYEIVKGDDEKFIDSQIVFYNGLGLEHHPNVCYQIYFLFLVV